MIFNIQSRKGADEQKLEHYAKLKGLGVDVNEYVLSQNPRPAKVIQVLGDGKAADFHLHQNQI